MHLCVFELLTRLIAGKLLSRVVLHGVLLEEVFVEVARLVQLVVPTLLQGCEEHLGVQSLTGRLQPNVHIVVEVLELG